MSVVDYLRERAAELRRLADSEADAALRGELLALAKQCERIANHTGGNGSKPA
jgi:hypothetical protein